MDPGIGERVLRTRLPARAACFATMVLLAIASNPALAAEPSAGVTDASTTGATADWGRVPFEWGLRDRYGPSHIEAIAAGSGGIVSVGLAPTGAAAWHSADGLQWQRAEAPASWTTPGRFPRLEDIVATDAGFVAVGAVQSDAERCCRADGTVWSSADGLGWQRTATGIGPYLVAITEHRGELFAASGRVHGIERAAVWRSPDARQWERVFEAPDGVDIDILGSDGSRLVAGDANSLFASIDGVTWSAMAFDDDPVEDAGINGLAATENGFLAVGVRDDRPAVWSSTDGGPWTTRPTDIATNETILSFEAVAISPDGRFLAIADDDHGRGYLYGSDDGVDWELLLEAPIPGVGDGRAFRDVVTSEAGVVIVGEYPDGPRDRSAAAWTSPAPSAVATEGRASTDCPQGRPDLMTLLEMAPGARLACFGDGELSFRAFLGRHDEFGDLDYYPSPQWLTAGLRGAHALPIQVYSPTTMELVLHVAPGTGRAVRGGFGRWARVTGHFDDRAARRCPRTWLRRCREAFVVTEIRVESSS